VIKDILSEKIKNLPLNQFGFIDPNIIDFSQEVRGMCEVNRCGKYGTNWQCPPAVGTVDERRRECLLYSDALLFNTVTAIEDSLDFEGMTTAGVEHTRLSFVIRDMMNELTGDYLLLGAGGCTICGRCAYLDNEPCRNPGSTTASMEACGINVVDLCPKTGFKFINGPDTVTYFSLILFNEGENYG